MRPRAKALLTGPNGARLRSRAGAAPAVELIPRPASRSMLEPQTSGSTAPALQLLTTQTLPGFSIMTSGTLFAWRRNGTWSFTEQQSAFDRSRLRGESKPGGGAALVVDEPADTARLKTLLAKHVAYAAKIQAAVGALTADLERDGQPAVRPPRLVRYSEIAE